MTDKDSTTTVHCQEGCCDKTPLDRLSRLAAGGVILIPLIALLGWIADMPVLHSILPGLPPMVPTTIAGLILAGTALFLLQPQEIGAGRRRAGIALAGLCLLVGLVTSIGYIQMFPALELDNLLLPLFPDESIVLKQSPHSALTFTLAGFALLLLGLNRKQLIFPVQWLAVLLLALSIVVLFGYIYGLSVFYSLSADIGMSLPTSVSFIILANGILLARPNEGVTGFITSNSAGGVLLRSLLPAVIVATMIINWLLMTSENRWGITEEFEHSMHAVMTTLLITLLFIAIAIRLNREERLRRSAEEGSRQFQADLAHLVRLVTMGEMVATIAHELKQPLTAINLYASNIQATLASEQLQPDAVYRYLNEIQSQSFRAAEIIRRTRDFARNQRPQTSMVQINDLIGEVRDFLRAEARDNHTELSVDFNPLLPPVEVDAIQIKQVLLNIIHNAIECLQRSEREEKRVVVRSRLTEKGDIRVDISDTGPGMDADTLARIFESFFTTKGEAGMGMGLSISRSIIEAHGGHLWATSTPGQGTTFSLTLPRGG